LEENLPPVGSIAWQGHRVRILLNELLRAQSAKQKRSLEVELNPLLTEETMKDALLLHYLEQNPSSMDNLLSNRFRKWIQEQRGILWEWRDWTWQVPTVLSMGVLSLWVHHTAPVTTFQFGNYISSVSFSPDSKTFLVSNEVGDLGICNDAKWLQGVETQQPIVATCITNTNHSSLAAITEKGNLMTWQLDKGEAQHSDLAGRVTTALGSADMQKVLAGYYLDRDAKLWDVKTKRSILFKSHQDAVISVAFSADESLIMTGSRDSTAKLWQITGELLQTFKGQNAVIQSVAISPDKTKVLTGGNNGKAILWDIRGNILHRFENQEYDVIGVHFSPDGKSLLTLSGQTAKLWSLNGQLLRTFEGHYATVVKAAFAPDQSKILTGDDMGHLKLWQLK
jgi:WD40 repeat protein